MSTARDFFSWRAPPFPALSFIVISPDADGKKWRNKCRRVLLNGLFKNEEGEVLAANLGFAANQGVSFGFNEWRHLFSRKMYTFLGRTNFRILAPSRLDGK
ncbi:MAG TPA: hypothetical protein ENH53_02595 [Bacteroidetes bacterium]|nr:hypothetical protein [Bacteroidota bacterium]